MRYVLASLFLFFSVQAQAFPLTTTFTTSEFDDDMGAYIKVLSGTPSVVVACIGPNNSDPFTVGTLTTSTTRIVFKGPCEKLKFTSDTAGHSEVSWLGRVAP